MNDLDNVASSMSKVHQYDFLAPDSRVLGHVSAFRYPAPAVLPYSIPFAFSHPKIAQSIFIFSTFVAFALLLGRAMGKRGLNMRQMLFFLAPTCLLSYPMWFEWMNGNIEIFSFAVLGLGTWALVRKRPMLSGLCFGLIASIKIYPAILLGLLLPRRHYRAILFAIIFACIVSVACLAYITPSVAYSWHALGKGMDSYSEQMFSAINDSYGYDHSLMMLCKRLAQVAHFHRPHLVLHAYMIIVALTGAAVYFLRIRNMPILNQLFLLVGAAAFFPPSSYDYTLMMFYLPWALFVLYALDNRGRKVPGLHALMVAFAILFSPLSEFIFKGYMFGNLLRGVVFVCVFVHALRYRFPSLLDEGDGACPSGAIALG